MGLTRVKGFSLWAGEASGLSLVLDEPLSFWGGLDPATGEIIDRHHPQSGSSTTGTILVLPRGRGSSGASSVLAECIRTRSGPAGIVTRETDSMLLIGSLVAGELYGDRLCPIVVVKEGFEMLVDGRTTHIRPDGIVEQTT